MTAQFILYNREGCHLCEDMIEQFQAIVEQYQIKKQYQIKIQIIDVDRSPQLQEKYGISVPLLCYQNGEDITEVCKYYLDPVSVLSFLR